MFSLSVPIQCIFIGLQTPEVPKPLDPRTPVFYTNDVYGTFFFVFCFLFSLLFFHFTAAIFWPAIMQNSQFFSKADVCQNGNLIDYLLVSKAFNHSFGRASKHALSQERVVWARKALALKRGCHSD